MPKSQSMRMQDRNTLIYKNLNFISQKNHLQYQKWLYQKIQAHLSQCAKDILGASFSLSLIFIMGLQKPQLLHQMVLMTLHWKNSIDLSMKHVLHCPFIFIYFWKTPYNEKGLLSQQLTPTHRSPGR